MTLIHDIEVTGPDRLVIIIILLMPIHLLNKIGHGPFLWWNDIYELGI